MSQTQSTLQGFDDGEQPPKPSDERTVRGRPKCDCLWPGEDEIKRITVLGGVTPKTKEVHDPAKGGCGGVIDL